MGDNDTFNDIGVRKQFTIAGPGKGHMGVCCTISYFSLSLKLFPNKHLRNMSVDFWLETVW